MTDQSQREQIVNFIIDQLGEHNFDPELFDTATFLLIKDGKTVANGFYTTNTRGGEQNVQRQVVEGLEDAAAKNGRHWGVL